MGYTDQRVRLRLLDHHDLFQLVADDEQSNSCEYELECACRHCCDRFQYRLVLRSGKQVIQRSADRSRPADRKLMADWSKEEKNVHYHTCLDNY